jgi:hypothetical protein
MAIRIYRKSLRKLPSWKTGSLVYPNWASSEPNGAKSAAASTRLLMLGLDASDVVEVPSPAAVHFARGPIFPLTVRTKMYILMITTSGIMPQLFDNLTTAASGRRCACAIAGRCCQSRIPTAARHSRLRGLPFHFSHRFALKWEINRCVAARRARPKSQPA